MDPHLALLDDARHADAVEARRRDRLLAAADEADATLEATLAARVVTGARCVVTTTVGTRHVGRLAAVSQDHLRLVADAGTCLVPLAAVALVGGADGDPLRPVAPETGPRERAADGLRAALVALAEGRPVVRCLLAGGVELRGRLLGVGQDLLRVEDERGTTCLVASDRLVALLTDPEEDGR